MKNNIDFYRHDVNAHTNAKIKMLRIKYGWSGEGKFWALNGIIGQSDNCLFDIEKKFNKAYLCSELDFNMEELEEFIKYLISDCELLYKSSEGITTNDVQEILDRVMKDRKRMQKQYKNSKKTTSIQHEENKNLREENIQSKVKESKVKNNTGNFKKPTIKEIRKYCLERKNNIDVEKFYNYYESNGWKVGKNKMKNWEACIRTWESNNKDQSQSQLQAMKQNAI